jgi:hypothetical protein
MYKDVNRNKMPDDSFFIREAKQIRAYLTSRLSGIAALRHTLGISLVIMIVLSGSLAVAQDTLWTKIYGGDENDILQCIAQTADNGFVALGTSASYGDNDNDLMLLKIDSMGETIWMKTYGTASADAGVSLCVMDNGEIILAGYTEGETRDICVYKVNSHGDVIWNKAYGGGAMDEAYSICKAPNDCFIIAGYTTSFGMGWRDYYLMKFNGNGDTLWTKTYGGVGSDVAYWIEPIADGCYAVCGYANINDDDGPDYWLIKIDENGDSLWSAAYGGAGSDEAHVVRQTSDGGFIIAGNSSSFGGGTQFYMVKADGDGNEIWSRVHGTIDSEICYGILELPEYKGYIVGGFSYNWNLQWFNYYLVRTDIAGDTLWTRKYGDMDDNDRCYALGLTPDGGFIMAGSNDTFSPGNHLNCYITKIAGDYLTDIEDRHDIPSSFELTGNYPNPFNASTIIDFTCPAGSDAEIDIYNICGQVVRSYTMADLCAGEHSIIWNGEDNSGESVSSGVYYYKIRINDVTDIKAMTLLK